MPGFSDTMNNSDNIHNGNSKSDNFDYTVPNMTLEILKSVRNIEAELSGDPRKYSQGGARDSANDRTGPFKQRYDERQQGRNAWSGGRSKKPQSFTDGLEEALWEGLLGSDFKKNIGNVLNGFAKDLGVDIKDLQGEVGKQLGKMGVEAFKSTSLGKSISSKIDSAKSKFFNSVADKFGDSTGTGQAARSAASSATKQAATDMAGNAAKQAATKVATETVATEVGTEAIVAAGQGGVEAAAVSAEAGAAAGAMGTLASVISSAVPWILAIMVALELLEPVITSVVNLFKVFGRSANRYEESRKKFEEAAKTRMEEDVKTIILKPFEVLKEAADRVYDAWDSNLRLITGTQGYTKADYQDLLSSYANRLRSEGLTDVIGTTDINKSLASVLESGLSGEVANEFAYIATKLNAAIPTEDFFSYASDYASIAANQIRLGKSQSEAIAFANSELESFASNVLYASREIAGGFTTGLKDASSLFKSAVQIQQASKTGNVSTISGVLTSVAAITGAIAPDLSTAMTDAITKAAMGGNSSEIVALRSLAGINAGNTEFLRQLAEDPKSVFSTLFRNLANMQNMAPDANMEVAEGLSSVFGLSMDAFSRIDFNYLAEAISSMDVNNASLAENIAHLASGETTTSAESLRLQQINKYMIDEGLSYVLDNEVARSIQEHMWQEQQTREITEATYGVEIQGSAIDLLQSIVETIDNIVNLLNPFSWIRKGMQILGTAKEAEAQQADIQQILELGKVGSGNTQSLYQLTTRNADLGLVSSYVDMLGGTSAYSAARAEREANNAYLRNISYRSRNWMLGGVIGDVLFGDAVSSYANATSNMVYDPSAHTGTADYISDGAMSSSFSNSRSKYSWGNISKSAYKFLSSTSKAIQEINTSGKSSNSASSEDITKQILQSKFDKFIESDYVNKFTSEEDGYNKWVATAKNFGIADFNEAIEELGYTEDKLQALFRAEQTANYQQEQQQRLKDEEDFWRNTQDYQLIIKDNTITILSEIQTTNAHLLTIEGHWGDLLQKWSEYFVNHTVYNSRFNANDVARINDLATQDSKEAVYKLADAIISGNKDLMDPNVQTNVLLSQILLVVQAIMQQNNTPGSLAIADTLQAMSTGLFNLNK